MMLYFSEDTIPFMELFPFVVAGGSSNLGSAVATSMNLTNSSEPMGDSGPNGAYKIEGPHDMMYPYQVRATTKRRQSATLISVFFKRKCSSGLVS